MNSLRFFEDILDSMVELKAELADSLIGAVESLLDRRRMKHISYCEKKGENIMNEIYFEVPATTDEANVTVIHGEEYVYDFCITFFESKCSKIRMVTIRSNCTDDLTENVESLHHTMDDQHSNEFIFRFKLSDKTEIHIEVCMDDKRRIIRVR